MRSALKNTKDQDIGYKPATTKPEFRENPTNKMKIENNKLEKENKQKWPTRKRDKELQDWEANNRSPHLTAPLKVLEESSQNNEESMKTSGRNIHCRTDPFKVLEESSQKNEESMKASSRNIHCRTAPSKVLEESSQKSEESMKASGRNTHCRTAPLKVLEESSQKNEESMGALY